MLHCNRISREGWFLCNLRSQRPLQHIPFSNHFLQRDTSVTFCCSPAFIPILSDMILDWPILGMFFWIGLKEQAGHPSHQVDLLDELFFFQPAE